MRTLFDIDAKNYADCPNTFVRPSVRAVIIRGKTVAMVHSLQYDYYKFPGGGPEPGETHADALMRETAEEAGLTVLPESIREYGMVHRIQKSTKTPDTCFVQDNFYYLCCAGEETVPQSLDDYEAAEHFTLEFVTPEHAIAVNRENDHGPKDKNMLEREAKVLEMLTAEGYFFGDTP